VKICIDARNMVFEGKWAGTTFYTLRLIEHLRAVDPSSTITLYFNFFRGRLHQRVPVLHSLDVRTRVLRLPRKYADPLCDDLHFPIDLLTGRFDILHGPAYELLHQRRGRSVVTIHDLSFHHFPEWLGAGWRDHFIKDVRSAIRRADLFITVSEFIRDEMVEHLGVAEDRIVPIHHGVEPRFTVEGEDDERDILKNRHDLPDLYLLSVATQEPKKNIPGLLRAYRILLDRIPGAPRLVLVGKRGWGPGSLEEETSKLGLQNKVVFLGYISTEDLPGLYRHAELFLFPSLYEGFGMPLLEAMASGCPVVASRISAIPEVTGDAGVLIDPHDPEEISGAIADLLLDDERRRDLSRRGIERAARFTWEETARKTLETYRRLL
jgi:glycosyltransferase involved in cell wall biosynthesis